MGLSKNSAHVSDYLSMARRGFGTWSHPQLAAPSCEIRDYWHTRRCASRSTTRFVKGSPCQLPHPIGIPGKKKTTNKKQKSSDFPTHGRNRPKGLSQIPPSLLTLSHIYVYKWKKQLLAIYVYMNGKKLPVQAIDLMFLGEPGQLAHRSYTLRSALAITNKGQTQDTSCYFC